MTSACRAPINPFLPDQTNPPARAPTTLQPSKGQSKPSQSSVSRVLNCLPRRRVPPRTAPSDCSPRPPPAPSSPPGCLSDPLADSEPPSLAGRGRTPPVKGGGSGSCPQTGRASAQRPPSSAATSSGSRRNASRRSSAVSMERRKAACRKPGRATRWRQRARKPLTTACSRTKARRARRSRWPGLRRGRAPEPDRTSSAPPSPPRCTGGCFLELRCAAREEPG